MHTHATTQTHTIPHCLRLTVWTSDILSLITCSQHNATQHSTTNKSTNFSFFFLSLLCPLTVIFFPLSFCFGIEDEGWGGGLRSKQGWRENERLAPANNPLFQHVQPHISKLKWNARKGAYKTLNVLWLNCCVHITLLPALPQGPAEYCGICSAAVN